MRVLALVAISVGLFGCSSGVGRPVKEVVITPGNDGVQHVEVTAHSFYFDPNRVVVKSGVPVEFHVKNSAFFVPHNLSCPAPGAGFMLDEGLGMFGDSETAKFTPTTPGEYAFFCKIDGHSKKGMTGTIVVVP
jgi:plastocyanin